MGTRSPLPILQGVLVEVTGKTMRVTGTDLEVTVRTVSVRAPVIVGLPLSVSTTC